MSSKAFTSSGVDLRRSASSGKTTPSIFIVVNFGAALNGDGFTGIE